MKELFISIARRNSILLLVIFLAAFFQRLGVAEGLLTVMLWVFAYRLVAEERNNRTWNFFQSLPIPFAQKALVKIVAPVMLMFALQMLGLDARETFSYPLGAASYYFALSVVMVTASILANSVVTFLIYALICFAFFSMPETPSGQIFFAGLGLTLSVFYLSDKRLPWQKLFTGGTIAAIGISLIHHQIVTQLLYGMLDSGRPRSQVDAAELILEENEDHEKARKTVVKLVESNAGATLLRDALYLSRVYDIQLNLSQDLGWTYIERDKRTREIMLRHFKRVRDNDGVTYPWLTNIEAVTKLESFVLIGVGECDDDCEELAEFIGPSYLNLADAEERLVRFL